MKCKIVVVCITILAAYGPWHVHGAVNCTVTGSGYFIDPDDPTCTKFSLCLYPPGQNKYIAFDYTCPAYTIFDPALSICTPASNLVCKPPVCTDEGVVPDPDSSDCTTFITCLWGDKGSLTKTPEACPEGSVFEPTTKDCVTDYTCPEKFRCREKGYVANIKDKTCQSYYYCSSLANDKYTSYDYKCPGIWKFHPIFKVCTPFYKCDN